MESEYLFYSFLFVAVVQVIRIPTTHSDLIQTQLRKAIRWHEKDRYFKKILILILSLKLV